MKFRFTALTALALGTSGIAAAALLPATASASASASASATQPPRAPQQVLTLTVRYSEASFHFVGKDAAHPKIGDEFIDDGPVRKDGKVVGRLANICTLVEGTSEATEVTQCVGTLRLAQGLIVTTGASGSGDDTTDAITGGTGDFAYIRGTAETVSGAGAATFTYRYLTAD